MNIGGFHCRRGLAFIVCGLFAASTAFAQSVWKPEKNVEIVVGLTPGSSQDRTARFLQNIWQKKNFSMCR